MPENLSRAADALLDARRRIVEADSAVSDAEKKLHAAERSLRDAKAASEAARDVYRAASKLFIDAAVGLPCGYFVRGGTVFVLTGGQERQVRTEEATVLIE